MLVVGTWCFYTKASFGTLAETNSDRTAIALEALQRLKGIDLENNPAIKAAVFKLLNQIRDQPEFVQLVRDFQIKDQEAALLQFARRHPRDPAAVDAVRMVLDQPDRRILASAMADTNAVGLLEAMVRCGDKAIVPWLSPVVTNSSTPLPLRKEVVVALSRLQDGAAELLNLAKQGKLPDDLKLIAGSELNQVRWPDLKAQAAQLLPLSQIAGNEPLPPISELAKMKGDATRGAGVFRRETVGCLKCHQVNGEGIDFGPNLSEIGGKLAREALFESILDPSAGISFGYEAWQLELKNGDEAYGLLVSETTDDLAIKAMGGAVTHYKKSDILSRQKQKVSIMPSGLQQAMSLQELIDLVEYLATLKKSTR
jgi:putative heme-binding domain-containing protein